MSTVIYLRLLGHHPLYLQREADERLVVPRLPISDRPTGRPSTSANGNESWGRPVVPPMQVSRMMRPCDARLPDSGWSRSGATTGEVGKQRKLPAPVTFVKSAADGITGCAGCLYLRLGERRSQRVPLGHHVAETGIHGVNPIGY